MAATVSVAKPVGPRNSSPGRHSAPVCPSKGLVWTTVCAMRRWSIAAASAVVVANTSVAAGTEAITVCGEGYHADPQAVGEKCAGAVGQSVRNNYLQNLGRMNLAEYQLACCLENKCVPWAQSFQSIPRGYELLFEGGATVVVRARGHVHVILRFRCALALAGRRMR